MIRSLLGARVPRLARAAACSSCRSVVVGHDVVNTTLLLPSPPAPGTIPQPHSYYANIMNSKRHFTSADGGTGGTGSGGSGGGGDQELRPSDQDLLAKEKAKAKGKTTSSRRRMMIRHGQRDRPGEIYKLMGTPLQTPAGPLWGSDIFSDHEDEDDEVDTPIITPGNSYIPEVKMYEGDGREKKRVLILCTGGTLTMAPDPKQGGALAPVEGAISSYMQSMNELFASGMPEFVLHEYTPFVDSSDLGPADWKTLAEDIKANYLHFDGFVILTGTDTMAYCATALSFMLENLGKPVIFTGSQIPLCEPYNDARRNLIMALIFASRDSINEVSIFFHDRLIRANRATKVNTHRLLAFDSPNLDPLAKIGIAIDENEHLVLPPPKGALRVHTRMDTRLLTIRLVPGFDDQMIRTIIESNSEQHRIRAIVLMLYGTGNLPSVKESFIQILADASDKGILVIASTQCFTGSVMMVSTTRFANFFDFEDSSMIMFSYLTRSST
jgi:L-asparaginase